MKKIKALIFLITLVVVVVALGSGAMWLAAQKRQKRIQSLVALADEYLAKGECDSALSVANEVIERYGARDELAHLHYVQARAYEKTGRPAEALDRWRIIRENFSNSPYAPEATIGLAMAELAKGGAANVDAAYELFREIEAKYPKTEAYYGALLGFAKIDIQDGQLAEAQKTLFRLLDEAGPDYSRRKEAQDLLGDLNVKILHSPITLEGEQMYEVKQGDALERIGKKFGVNYQVIMLANRIEDPRRLRLGQRLKIPNVQFSIVVDLAENTLTLLNHGKFFKSYPVRTGEGEGQTPTGKYAILLKEKNPAWDHDGKHYPPGDPENELGTRWMAFQGADLGIHGTIHPETVGKYTSNGCVGMLMKDVEELFDLVPLGTTIEIVGARKAPRKRGDERTETASRPAQGEPARVDPGADREGRV